MKKAFLFILCLAVTGYASDRAGQDNTTIQSDMITQFYTEAFGGITSAPYKFADTTTVENLLNSSLLDASTDFYCVERDTTIAITASTYWYTLPSDFYDVPLGTADFGVVSKAKNTGVEKAMQPIAVDQIGLLGQIATGNEQPARYVIRKGKIYVEPAQNTSDTLIVYYAALANELDTLTDTTNVDRKYIRYAVLRAVETFLRTRNWGSYQGLAAERLGYIQAEIAKEQKRLGITRNSLLEKVVQ